MVVRDCVQAESEDAVFSKIVDCSLGGRASLPASMLRMSSSDFDNGSNIPRGTVSVWVFKSNLPLILQRACFQCAASGPLGLPLRLNTLGFGIYLLYVINFAPLLLRAI